jgi:hypothetical protein
MTGKERIAAQPRGGRSPWSPSQVQDPLHPAHSRPGPGLCAGQTIPPGGSKPSPAHERYEVPV